MDRIKPARENRIRRLERIRSNRLCSHHSLNNNAIPNVNGHGRNRTSNRRNTITMRNSLGNCLRPSDVTNTSKK